MSGGNPHIIVPALEVLDTGLLEELLVPDRTIRIAIVDLETAGIPYPEIAIAVTFNGSDIVVHQSLGYIIEVPVPRVPAPVIRGEAKRSTDDGFPSGSAGKVIDLVGVDHLLRGDEELYRVRGLRAGLSGYRHRKRSIFLSCGYRDDQQKDDEEKENIRVRSWYHRLS
jgi:hypothetical protein